VQPMPMREIGLSNCLSLSFRRAYSHHEACMDLLCAVVDGAASSCYQRWPGQNFGETGSVLDSGICFGTRRHPV
jgi:hypothetical protein